MTPGISTDAAPAADLVTGEHPSAPRDRVDVPETIRRRLAPPQPAGGWLSWVATAWVVGIAALLRLWNLGYPPGKIFDEVYYATEGEELLHHGVEWRLETDSAGSTTASYGDFVVHPPLGKWIIGLGIQLFDNNAFGWRFSSAIVGIASVLILTRTARRMFRSTALGCTAGLLMALDGMHLVLSRTAILDIFVMFFVLAAFACLVLDRDARRRRWLRELEHGLDPARPGRAGRPRLTWSDVPWWRLAAGVMLGAGCAVKWSAIWFLPVYVLLIVAWEVGTRRSVGVRRPWLDTLLDETGWVAALGAVMVATYLASWTGWFASDYGWSRHYLLSQGRSEPPVLGALYNLLHYHQEMLAFHTGLTSPHQYQSWPWQWLLLGRPVAFYWSGDPNCGAAKCAAEILLLGTPVLWWTFPLALAGVVWFGLSRRDWRAWAIGAGVVAGVVPWFYYELKNRTMFYFYALPAEPFLVLAVVYLLGALMTGPGVGRLAAGRVRTGLSLPVQDRRLYGVVVAAAFILLVALCFWWFYPVYVGRSIPYDDWLRRMWLRERWY